MKIYLHIDRLALDGVPLQRTQSGQVRAAVEQELARLLVSGGLSQDLMSGGAVPSLRAGSVRIQKQGSAAALGQDIARAVHQGIGAPAGPDKKK
jgi:hypothetical protein